MKTLKMLLAMGLLTAATVVAGCSGESTTVEVPAPAEPAAMEAPAPEVAPEAPAEAPAAPAQE